MNKIDTPWSKNETPYYHFTSLNALIEILAARKLRLTSCNIAKNSAVEVMAMYSAIQNIINKNKDLQHRLLQIYQCNIENLAERIVAHREQSFIACFTIKKDREESEILDSLYMWKFYADNSKGVVLKFNYEWFPFISHQTNTTADDNRKFIRSHEIRMDLVIYGEIQLQEKLNQLLIKFQLGSTQFATDVYKPEFCELENEIRFLVYLPNRMDLYSYPLEGISYSDEEPECLYYDLTLKEKNASVPLIEKIFCRDLDTFNKVCSIFDDRERVVLI